jgi:O-antigen/teichoic acid export membrane protein
LAISNLLAEGSDLGLDYGVVRFGGIARGLGDWGRFQSTIRSAVRGCLIAGVIAGGALATGSTLGAEIFHKPSLLVLVPLAIAVPFTATTEVLRAGLRAMGNAFRPVASASLITPSLRLCTGVVAVLIVPSARAVALGYMGTEVVVCGITALMLWRLVPRIEGPRPASVKGLYRFSLPMSLNRILLYSNNQTEIFFLGIFAPTDTLGIFYVSRRLSLLLSSLLASIALLFNPMAADLHHSGRMDELDHVFKTATRWLLTIGLPVCLIEVLFSPLILKIFGNGYAAGATALGILALGQLVNVGTGTVANLQAMTGYAKLTLLNSLLFLTLSIILDLLLIPSFGIVGAALANSTSLVVVNVLRLWQIHRNLGLTPYDRSFLRPIAAAVPAALVGHFVPLEHLQDVFELLARATALGVVYLGCLSALGFEPIDREIARAVVARLRNRQFGQAQMVRSGTAFGLDGDE